jgi:hypothetical protein
MATGLWPVLQQTIAATVAWFIATHVVQHHQPFFAPIAAVVALNTSLGERGLNALKLLAGVVLGIVTGEVAIRLLGGGLWALAFGTLVATGIAHILTRTRIVMAQAAASAILVVATATEEAGADRLGDALIGTAVALVSSQVLFSPHPLALLRRAETAALRDMADGLRLTAQAADCDDPELAVQAITSLRNLRDRLSDVARTRSASRRVVRHSVLWRTQKAPVLRENENAGVLDLLGGSCLTLARTVLADGAASDQAAEEVRRLADALADLASAPGDRDTRRRAGRQTIDVMARLEANSKHRGSPTAVALHMVGEDLLSFVGVEPDEVPDSRNHGNRTTDSDPS